MKNYWFIGDIHGEIDLLNSLLRAISRYDPELIVFVGDYIDRGPQSRAVVDRVMGLEFPAACLMGNHEHMMLSALEDLAVGYNPMELWYYNGAEATLQSFGFSGFFSFQSQMDPGYLHFFRNLKLSYVIEAGEGLKILATHAGVSPSMPLADQLLLKDYQDLQQYMKDKQLDLGDTFLWTREPFFNSPAGLWKGYVVVHGHTPTPKVKQMVEEGNYPDYHFIDHDLVIRRGRENGQVLSVGIDSGSVYTGRLSGLGFFSEQEKENCSRFSMRSLTVTREEIIPRDLGPVCS
jgi:serine/threonine protein phosphatase 1